MDLNIRNDTNMAMHNPTWTEQIMGLGLERGKQLFFGFLALDENELQELPEKTYDEYVSLMQDTPKKISTSWIEEYEDLSDTDSKKYRKMILERNRRKVRGA